MTEKNLPFNNKVETGLRVLSILNAAFPASIDLQTLVYLDYLTVHSGDVIDGMPSLHPPVSSRKGEMYVRRSIINDSLDLYISKGLIIKLFLKNGIEYAVSENSTPFLESLSEEYLIELQIRANWVHKLVEKLGQLRFNKFMSNFMTDNSFHSINLISND